MSVFVLKNDRKRRIMLKHITFAKHQPAMQTAHFTDNTVKISTVSQDYCFISLQNNSNGLNICCISG